MARLINKQFDPTQSVFARKYFIANGHRYEPGMIMPWRNIGISQRRIAQMFDAGKISHDDNIVTTKDTVKPETVVAQNKALDDFEEAEQYWDATDFDFDNESILSETDDLDDIDDMKELRRIADAIGAGYKVSKVDQRQVIRDKRKEMNNG